MCENIEIGVAENNGIYSTTIEPTTTDDGGYTPPTNPAPDAGTTTDEGGYTPPTDPAPDAGTTTEDDGVHDDPENPSGDMNDSSETTTCSLPAPTGLRAEILGNNSMKISWNPVEGAKLYTLRASGVVYSGENNYTIETKLESGRTYNFRVQAHDGVSASPYSEKITITMSLQEPLLIYRTRNREVYGFEDSDSETPTITEDLEYCEKSEQIICNNGTLISLSDLYTNIFSKTQYSIEQRRSIMLDLFNEQIGYDVTFTEILANMVDHFIGKENNSFIDTIDGYNVYSNSALTEIVKNHNSTLTYVNGFISLLNTLLQRYAGKIDELLYDENLWTQTELRKKHPVVKSMLNDDGKPLIPQPVYGIGNGTPGLTLAIDGLEGNKIEIVKYEFNDESYSGILRFSLYDHFGLDTLDLTENKYHIIENGFSEMTAGMFAGFRQWYILQHWDELSCSIHPKPFITMITFTVPFSGLF